MKTINDLFEIMAKAAKISKPDYQCWFFYLSGHVNQLEIKYFFTGWQTDSPHESLKVKLNETGIQSAYWFIASHLES